MRISTERAAFEKLIPEMERTWSGIVAQYSGKNI
jgi:hypothetical protein